MDDGTQISSNFLPIIPEIVEQLIALESQSTSWGWSAKNMFDSLQQGHDCYYLTNGEYPIGYFVLMEMNAVAEILNLVIFNDFKNQGNGQILLSKIIEISQQLNVNEVWLEVRESNTLARRLYRSAGFTEGHIRKDYYPPSDRGVSNSRESAILMHLKITL